MDNKKEVTDMTIEEMEALLLKKKAKKQAEEIKLTHTYETRRNETVLKLSEMAMVLHANIKKTKELMLNTIFELKEMGDEYAGIKDGNQGSMSWRSADNNLLVRLDKQVKSDYDDRAKNAEILLKDFLIDTVKKRDKASYELISGILQKNKRGDYSPEMISKLIKLENHFTDERFTKAIKLFKESYTQVESGFSLSFFEKDQLGKDQHISLSFPNIPVEINTK